MGGKCDYPVCPGHHHKFSDCQTEAENAFAEIQRAYDAWDSQDGEE